MNCLSQMFKFLVYLLNVIFVVGGILLIVFGSIMLSSMSSLGDFSDGFNARTIPICIIVIGCFIFLVAFFGCCGTIRENVCCTSIYAVSMLVLFGLQLALSIWIFAASDKFVARMGELVDAAWKQNDAVNGFPMDALQLSFKCCGKNSFLDYTSTVPASCCGYLDRTAPCDASIYSERPACRQKFTDFFSQYTDIISWVSLIVALFELSLCIISCCLAKAMRKR